MKLNNLKKMLLVFVIGLITFLGTSIVTNAQTRRQVERRQAQIERQQQRAIRQRQRQIRQRQIGRRQIQQNNRYRVYNNGRYYNTDSRGAELLRQAVRNGYQQGVRAGQYDRSNRIRRSYTITSEYRRGNYGYRSDVNSSQYQHYFRQGFQRGYQDGYSRRYRNGTNNNGAFNILGSILNGILNIRQN